MDGPQRNHVGIHLPIKLTLYADALILHPLPLSVVPALNNIGAGETPTVVATHRAIFPETSKNGRRNIRVRERCMSRKPFHSILKNAEELGLDYFSNDEEDEEGDDESSDNVDDDDEERCDTEGYSLYDWVNYAEVGWDEPLQTYFLQAIEQDGGPVWWFGQRPREIPTFENLCDAINDAFDGKVKFDFVDTIEKP